MYSTKFKHDERPSYMQSGQKVTSLDELQDIDELSIVEGPEPTPAGAGAPSTSDTSMRMGSTSTSGAQAGDKQVGEGP